MSTTRFLLPLILALATCWANKPISDNVPQFFQETFDDSNFRLPEDIKPLDYNITLRPVFNTSNDKNFTFTGTSVINLEVVKATKKIIFHAENLNIDFVSLLSLNPISNNNSDTSNSSIEISIEKIIEDKQSNLITLVSEEDIQEKVRLKLTLNFTGTLKNDDLRGFYRSSYKNDAGEEIWLGTTHFEPVGARRAFPCWDEPAMKAKFTITIITPTNSSVQYSAISNMKVNEDQTNKSIDKTVFNTSPKMPPYLVAFVVSNFQNNTNNNDFTVWTKPEAFDSTEFALEIGQEVLKELEVYTTIEYNKDQGMQKLDQISIPDFAAGAMENWGLVTYRESALLYTKNKTTTENKQSIATVISHEFSHQWFGNLVTCEWWNYIWLNEGFATFFQYFITDKVMQKRSEDWRLMEQFAIKNLQASAFVVDASNRTRALNPKNSIKTRDQILSLFDDIAYKKGASILRMMQQFLGHDVFRNGLINYLNLHRFETANSSTLFEAIRMNVTKDVSDAWGNITLATIMKNWVEEPGYPVVNVTRHGLDLNLKQNRFYLVQPPNPDKTEWYISVNYVTQKAVDKVQGPYLLKPGEQLNITNASDAASWVLFNINQTGYYRVNYDEENWNHLSAFLKTDKYTNINAVNRAQLIDDALNLARGKYLKYDVALRITAYLSKETDYIPWYATVRAFNYLDNVLQSAKKDFHEYVVKKITLFAQSVKYEDAYNGTHVQKLAKVLALDTACKYGLEDCNKFASKKLNEYLYNGETLPIDLRRGILCAGFRTANNETVNKAQEKYKNTKDKDEKADILAGLGCITSEEIITTFLESTLETELLFDALNSVCTGNVASFNVLMKFITQHTEKMQNANPEKLIAHLNKLAGRITSTDQYLEITSFITRLQLSEGQKTLNWPSEGLANALENIAWIERHREEVVKWIQESEKSETTTPKPASANSLTLTSFLVIIPMLLARL